MAYQFLQTRRDGSIEFLTLNRPDVRNAFNDEVVAELTRWASATSETAEMTGLRAVVLGGAGKVFCAGADLTWMSKMVAYTEEENLRDAVAMSRMFGALNTLPVPLIGRIHGAALGGGCGLAAVCDIVVASAGDLDAAIAQYVREILTAAPKAIAAGKALIPRVWNAPADEATSITAKAIAARRISEEGQEGMKAFLEKRAPSWADGLS